MEKAIAKAAQNKAPEVKAKESVNVMLNGLLDGQKMRSRFEELLGNRTAQFMSSLVTMINDNESLQAAFYESPMSVIKSALQAASYDLPIDPALGFAYIVPFNNRTKVNGEWVTKHMATFVIGYKGLIQLCLRTGAYKIIPDAVDVREGELVRYDRLTGDCEFDWIEDEDLRQKKPIIGYAGYFRLNNGAEKTIYMSKAQIEAHEKKFRKGDYMGKGWKDDFDAMARKTVIRKLCSKYALMSIQYQSQASAATMNMATAMAAQELPETNQVVVETSDGTTYYEVDEGTGEVVSPMETAKAETVPVNDTLYGKPNGGTLPFGD